MVEGMNIDVLEELMNDCDEQFVTLQDFDDDNTASVHCTFRVGRRPNKIVNSFCGTTLCQSDLQRIGLSPLRIDLISLIDFFLKSSRQFSLWGMATNTT